MHSPALVRPPRLMATNMPIDLLRSFVAVVETGSLAHATETILLTQSALSLQMKRLEDVLQQKLFRRNGRKLSLTPAGEELVSYARQMLALNDRMVLALGRDFDPEPISLGLVQDFADTILSRVLSRFRSMHPRARIVVRVGGSIELLEMFDRSRLDIVLCLGQHGDRVGASSKTVGSDRMVWLGQPDNANFEELPLVLLEPPCRFREAALHALGAANRSYRVVLETPNLPALSAGARAGLGVSCRTRRFAVSENLPFLPADALPALPEIETILVRRDGLSDTTYDLAELLQHAINDQ